jgi:hypothetical protein
MKAEKWRVLGWEHPLWELVRYYLSITTKEERESFTKSLKTERSAKIGKIQLKLEGDVAKQVLEYLDFRSALWTAGDKLLRTEEEAKAYCKRHFNELPKTTQTKNLDHHQSSKAMVLTATRLTEAVCSEFGVAVEPNPQRRCVWVAKEELHVTARNLDGAIPGLVDPFLVWEIKEYWGTTSGGSKMSDAVYECALVGRELRDFEKRTKLHVEHAVLLDGKAQWTSRKSDLLRFYDLYFQGLIDYLIVGREIETEWQPIVRSVFRKYGLTAKSMRVADRLKEK